MNKRELRRLSGIGKGRSIQKSEHYKRCFGRTTSLKRQPLKEELITFNIYIRSLNCT
jgi:hypothetical protein